MSEHLERLWKANPFDGEEAQRHSAYTGLRNGELVRLIDARPVSAPAHALCEAFRAFVGATHFSCLGAKAAFNRGTFRIGTYERLDDDAVTSGLARDLYAFVKEREFMRGIFTTFVAIFEHSAFSDELTFEQALWSQLDRLHRLDREHHRWDPLVSSDPEDRHFSFSIAETSFYVVGMSPSSSRTARRFIRPALIFNAHEQFDELRRIGQFAGLQKHIRRRELELCGSLNPNLADFGSLSEARQYSGRHVEEDWKCPFRTRN